MQQEVTLEQYGDMGHEDISPVQFGMLLAEVRSLRSQVTTMQADLRNLMALADRGKGLLMAAVGISSVIGGLFSYIIDRVPWGGHT